MDLNQPNDQVKTKEKDIDVNNIEIAKYDEKSD